MLQQSPPWRARGEGRRGPASSHWSAPRSKISIAKGAGGPGGAYRAWNRTGRDADEPAASSGGCAPTEFAVRVAAVVFRASDPLQSMHQGAAKVEQGQEGPNHAGGVGLLGNPLTCGGGLRRKFGASRALGRGERARGVFWCQGGAVAGSGRGFGGVGWCAPGGAELWRGGATWSRRLGFWGGASAWVEEQTGRGVV